MGSDTELYYTDSARRLARGSHKQAPAWSLGRQAKSVDFISGDAYKEECRSAVEDG
jgi:hypothetical protein